MFLTTPDRRERRLIGSVLARHHGYQYYVLVSGVFEREAEDVRICRDYAWLLGRLGPPRQRAPRHKELQHALSDTLPGLLGDPPYRVRAATAGALASLGAHDALPRLRAVAAEDPVTCVLDAAAAAIRRLT